MVLVFHLMSEDHVIKASLDIMSWSHLWKVTILPTLVALDAVLAEM